MPQYLVVLEEVEISANETTVRHLFQLTSDLKDSSSSDESNEDLSCQYTCAIPSLI